MRERALREMGLAPGWVLRHAVTSGEAASAAAPHEPISSTRAVAVERLTPQQALSLDLDGLRLAIGGCEACPRAQQRSSALAGEGRAPARLMVVDHVPSQSDAANGALRDGEAARLFDQLLFSVGLKREAIYFTHALRCDGAEPSDDEAGCCAPYLQREIELLAPRALLVLGMPAADAVKRYAGADAPRMFVLTHPTELLSDAARKRGAWVTLRELRVYLAEG